MTGRRECPTDALDGWLTGLTAEAAAITARHAGSAGLTAINEAKHLHPACKQAAKTLAATWQPAPAIGPYGFGDKLGWVGLGLVDMVFRWPGGDRTFLELKCGASSSSLTACSWDAVKLASGLLAGNAASGYLLAGAPTASWRQSILGASLFDAGTWTTTGPEIRDAFATWWRHWQEESSPHVPGRVAARFETVPVTVAPLTVGETPWELRLARVNPVGDEWADWIPFG